MRKSSLALVLITLVAGLAVCAQLAAQQAIDRASGTHLRVGIFDSRAIAVAYARSEEFNQYIKDLRTDLAQAKAEGNDKLVNELETLGPALQQLMHKQGFSTWPVDDILERIKDQIPEIAKQAGVDIIVSKWDIVYQLPGVEFIDVTDLLVMPFAADASTLDLIKSLREIEPVSLEELEELESE